LRRNLKILSVTDEKDIEKRFGLNYDRALHFGENSEATQHLTGETEEPHTD
jgi:hypothetical protein